MIAVASFLVFNAALFGFTTIGDPVFIALFSLGVFCISIGEIANHQTIREKENADLHQVDPFTGKSLGFISGITFDKDPVYIRKTSVAGIVFYILGTLSIITSFYNICD
jgi:hypothetical protein